MGTNYKIFVHNAGCWTRSMDAMKLIKYFILNRCLLVEDYMAADYILLLTCGVTKSAQTYSLELLRNFNKAPGELIVLGCLPGIAPEKLKEEFHGKVLVTSEIEKIDEFFSSFVRKYKDLSDSNAPFLNFAVDIAPKGYGSQDESTEQSTLTIDSKPKEKMGYLRISHGCLGSCTYCAIRFATGKLTSKPIDVIAGEYKKLLNDGVRNFLITAEDCGNYGKDIKSSLDILFDKLSDVDKELDTKWSIASLSPDCLIEFKDKITELVKIGKITSIECDLQSGNPRILKLMNRFIDIDKVLEIVNYLKEVNPTFHLHSQFIVGFPTEGEQDFLDSLNIALKLNADALEFFAYSDLEAAPSYKMQGKISQTDIKKRLDQVRSFFEDNAYYYCWNLNGIFLAKTNYVSTSQLFGK